jgi:MFS family permease
MGAGGVALGLILILAGVAVIVGAWTAPCGYDAAPDCGYAPVNSLIGLVVTAGGVFLLAGAATGVPTRKPLPAPTVDSVDERALDPDSAPFRGEANLVQRGPVLAFALTFSAAMLVLVEGLALDLDAALLGTSNYAAVGELVSEVAALGLTIGFILLVLAVGLYFSRLYRGFISVGILFFSVLSFFGGGGFFLGMILGCIGGVLGLLYVPDWIGDGSYEIEVDGELYTRLRGTRAHRKCPNCGGIVYSDEMICLRCGLGVSVSAAHRGAGEATESPS